MSKNSLSAEEIKIKEVDRIRVSNITPTHDHSSEVLLVDHHNVYSSNNNIDNSKGDKPLNSANTPLDSDDNGELGLSKEGSLLLDADSENKTGSKFMSEAIIDNEGCLIDNNTSDEVLLINDEDDNAEILLNDLEFKEDKTTLDQNPLQRQENDNSVSSSNDIITENSTIDKQEDFIINTLQEMEVYEKIVCIERVDAPDHDAIEQSDVKSGPSESKSLESDEEIAGSASNHFSEFEIQNKNKLKAIDPNEDTHKSIVSSDNGSNRAGSDTAPDVKSSFVKNDSMTPKVPIETDDRSTIPLDEVDDKTLNKVSQDMIEAELNQISNKESTYKNDKILIFENNNTAFVNNTSATEETFETQFEENHFRAPKIICRDEKSNSKARNRDLEEVNDLGNEQRHSETLKIDQSGDQKNVLLTQENKSIEKIDFQVEKNYFRSSKVVCKKAPFDQNVYLGGKSTMNQFECYSEVRDNLDNNVDEKQIDQKLKLQNDLADHTPRKTDLTSPEINYFNPSKETSDLILAQKQQPSKTSTSFNKNSIKSQDISDYNHKDSEDKQSIEEQASNGIGNEGDTVVPEAKKGNPVLETPKKASSGHQTKEKIKINVNVTKEQDADYLVSESQCSSQKNNAFESRKYKIVKSNGEEVAGVRRESDEAEEEFLKSQTGSFVFEYVNLFPEIRKKEYYKNSLVEKIACDKKKVDPKKSIDRNQHQKLDFLVTEDKGVSLKSEMLTPTKIPNRDLGQKLEAISDNKTPDKHTGLSIDSIHGKKQGDKSIPVTHTLAHLTINPIEDQDLLTDEVSSTGVRDNERNLLDDSSPSVIKNTFVSNSQTNLDEKPIKVSKGNYDIDNLDSLQDTYVPSAKALALKAKREAMKKEQSENVKSKPGKIESVPVLNEVTTKDSADKPEAPKTKLVRQKVDVTSSSTKKLLDSDEIPLKSSSGGYNLDNLDSIADTYVPSSKASRLKSKNQTLDKETNETEVKKEIINKNNFLELEAEVSVSRNLNRNDLEQGVDPDSTLEGRMKSDKIIVRTKAYTDMLLWEDETITQSFFCKNLHLQIKEKNPQIFEIILTALEDILQNSPESVASLDKKKFLVAFAEFGLTNAKNDLLTKALSLVRPIFSVYPKEEFMSIVKEEMLKKSKPKLQENALVIILQLFKDGAGADVSYLKNVKDEMEGLTASRTPAIKNLSYEIYKETFLWMEEGVKVFMGSLKKPVFDELEVIFKSIDKSQMKNVSKEPGAKKKVVDAYDLSDEVELPKKFTEELWGDEILGLTKWSERKEKLDELIVFLTKNPRISPKLSVLHFINFGRRMLSDSNAVVVSTTLKLFGLMANSIRKPFYQVAKSLFSNFVLKLKEKNRSVNEESVFACEKFMSLLSFDEIAEEFKDQIKDKGIEKKINILKLLLVMIEKMDKIKTDVQAIKIAKMILFLLDDNEKVVRDTASQVIARLKDNWSQKIMSVLSDLNSQKLSKIQSFCREMPEVDSSVHFDSEYSMAPPLKSPIIQPSIPEIKVSMTKTTASFPVEPSGLTDKKSARKQPVSIGKDKKQLIREIRESMFSNRTVRISDVKTFTNYLYTQLKIISDLTKEFREINSTEVPEFTSLLFEISQKVEKGAFHDDSKKIILDFIFEQLQNRCNEEVNREVEYFIFSSTNKLYSPKSFLQDINETLLQRKTKPTKELVQFVLSVVEKEAMGASSISGVSLKQFSDFLKSNFTNQTGSQSTKSMIMSTIKMLCKKFGEKVLNDIPSNITKEFETSIAESQKSLSKMMERLLDKSLDKKRAALQDLSQIDDVSKVNVYWNSSEFVSILKRNIIVEYRTPLYSTIISILDNYLQVRLNSSSEFNSKNFLFVFQAVVTISQDNKGTEVNRETESFIERTIEVYSATALFHEMISLLNSINSRDQIMQFYLDHNNSNAIAEAVSLEDVDTHSSGRPDADKLRYVVADIRFMDFIITVLNLKNTSRETSGLVINCLASLKDCKDSQVILRGNEYKVIREIWQRSEEELLLNENFIKGYPYLNDPSTRTKTIEFLMKHLHLKFTSELFSGKFTTHDYQATKPLRVLLTYYLLRSSDNSQVLQGFLYQQITLIEKDHFGKSDKGAEVNELNCILVCKILFVLLKNLAWNKGVKEFAEMCDTLNRVKKKGAVTTKDLVSRLELSADEQLFLESLPGILVLEAPPTPNRNLPKTNTNTINKLENYSAPTNVSMNLSSMNNQREKAVGKKTVAMTAKSQRIDTDAHFNYNRNDDSTFVNAQSNFDNSANMTIPPLDFNGLLSRIALDEVIEKMMTFNLDLFQDASDYFQRILDPPSDDSLEFVIQNVDYIAETFTEVCKCVFENGIYYEITKESYELIFVPLQLLCQQPAFIGSMNTEVLSNFVWIVLEKLVMSNDEKTLLTKQRNPEQSHVDLAAFLVKIWNSIMLRIIEFSDSNNLLTILVDVVIQASNLGSQKLGDSIQSISFKCIIRITRNLEKFIEKIDLRVIFGLFYNYVNLFGEAETVGYKTLSTLLKEIVSLLDPQFIQDAYIETFNGEYEEFVSRIIGLEPPENDFESEIEGELHRFINEFNKLTRPSQVNLYVDSFVQLIEQATWINLQDYEGQFANASHYQSLMKGISLKLQKSNPKSGKTQGTTLGYSNQSNPQKGGRYEASVKSSNSRIK